MENTYIAQAYDLTAVADAIRAKGETAEPLVFPDGFVAAIQSITGGADLNFEIVGGMEKPTNPKENTIWIKTSTDINGWAFGIESPDNPVPGMVWIKTVDAGLTRFNALKTNCIALRILNSNQYDGSAWEGAEGMIYQSGSWNDLWDHGLFVNGEQYAFLTGGWTDDNYTFSGWTYGENTKGSVNKDAIKVQTVYATEDNYGGIVGTINPIHLGGFSALRVKGNLNSHKSQCRYWIGIHPSKAITKTPLAYTAVTAAGDFEKVLDLPEDVEEAYVFVMAGAYSNTTSTFTTTMTVTEIWLE